MKKLEALEKIGQSLWYDNIQRSMLQNGEIERMISRGEIKGMTSNPSIFQNAIVKSSDYMVQLQTLAWSGSTAEEIFWKIAIDDVQRAAGLFKRIYDKTNRQDGYVSIEVNPNLAHDTEGTINEAVGLWQKINRPNLMVKVPATKEGIPAIRKLISLGININVTLIFSVERYKEIAEAYISGLEDRISEGNMIDHIASVASFFVSRVDSKIDPMLGQHEDSPIVRAIEINDLRGKAAIYNSRLAYQEFKEIFSTPRFKALIGKGAKRQRPLWASTSTKNPSYRDVLYVEELIGKDTVNTVPPATLSAFLDHGETIETISKDINQIEPFFARLKDVNISIDAVAETLEKEGVKAFQDAFTGLLSVIEERCKLDTNRLGSLLPLVKERLVQLEAIDFGSRLWQHDASLWTTSPAGQKEISQRMGWLDAPWDLKSVTDQVGGLINELSAEGFTNALILGMGGSSLAPEVFSKIQSHENTGGKRITVSILDSTHPDAVLAAADQNPVEKTIFIVSSKSGTTGEINAFFNYFYEIAKKKLGVKAGSHFIAITDPGTKLELLAKEKNFRRIISANPLVGGRNSALTAFGIVPAILCGINVEKLMNVVEFNGKWFQPDQKIEGNPGVVLGAIIGAAATSGKDKLTILADDEWNAFAAWMEQLIAESSGKDGKGIIPIAEEPLNSIKNYGNDRLFVYIRKNGSLDDCVRSLVESGHPVIQLNVASVLDLGYQYYLWEVATATACSILKINSFDQPDVQDAKTRTLAGIEAYRKTGQFIISEPKFRSEEFIVYSKQAIIIPDTCTPRGIINQFVQDFLPMEGYVAINAFVPRNEENITCLNDFRKEILQHFGIATTLGFGPRYLHSTGQLHKGGPENGIFIIITNTPKMDIPIPGEGLTFGKFCFAQALGDEAALSAHGRKIIRINLLNADFKLD